MQCNTVGETSQSRFSRSAGACPPRSPASRCMCVSPSVVCDRLITNGSGSLGNMPELQTILTYRAWRENDGEGQALALREGAAFFSP